MPLLLHRVAGNQVSILGDLGVNPLKETIAYTQQTIYRCYSTYNARLGRKLEYSKETPEAWGEPAKLCMQYRNKTLNPGDARLTTKPLCSLKLKRKTIPSPDIFSTKTFMYSVILQIYQLLRMAG